MNKILLLTFFLLGACASRPLDRTEARATYLEDEQEVQERSAERADHAGRVAALASQIRAIDGQIDTQRLVVDRWRGMRDVPSAPAMIKNAKLRLRQLEAEKAELVRQSEAELEKIKDLEEDEES